jgi:hypothetical protein
MAGSTPLPRLGEVFFDARGEDRALRLSWYPDSGVMVFSVWNGDVCTATFRLAAPDLPALMDTLAQGVQERGAAAPVRAGLSPGTPPPDPPPSRAFPVTGEYEAPAQP